MLQHKIENQLSTTTKKIDEINYPLFLKHIKVFNNWTK